MSVIAVLDPLVSNQIAAGEVVERPSSVVKELIENSIDAGATAITIEIVDGGLTQIKITDNGCGMSGEDAGRAFLRHATSKIRTAEDLSGIATLGFRGEALAAIASVSRVCMWTRQHGSAFGTKIQLEGGNVLHDEPFGAPEGTSITVSDLFFNTPARKAFMKRPHVEAGYVQEVVLRAILSRPDISMRFTMQGKNVFHSTGDGSLEHALYCVYGKPVQGMLHAVSAKLPQGSCSGFIGDITLSRTNRKREHIAINGRPVNCFAISMAVEEAFASQLMVHKFPLFALNLDIPPEVVDVNVHPAKLEVRLRQEREIAQALTSAIAPVVLRQENPFASLYRAPARTQMRVTSDMLSDLPENAHPIPPKAPVVLTAKSTTQTAPYAGIHTESIPAHEKKAIAADVSHLREDTVQSPDPKNRSVQKPTAATVRQTAPAQPALHHTDTKKQPESIAAHRSAMQSNKQEIKPSAMPDKPENIESEKPASPSPKAVQQVAFTTQTQETQSPALPYRLIGQLFSTYLLLETERRLLVIDQHAAHERLLFDRYCAQIDAQNVVRQPLLVPYVSTLSAEEFSTLLDQQKVLEGIGFDIEEFGPLTVMVRTVPMLLGEPRMDDFLHETLEFLQNRSTAASSQMLHAQMATIACKAAIKAGDALTQAEIEQLLDLIATHRGALTCPHGRPIYFEMSKYEIEKRFKRV